MHRILSVFLFSLIMLAMPAASFAQSENTPVAGAGSVYCPQLSQTMVRGARDRTTVPRGQVTELQKFISDYYDVDPDDIVTGYFGALTHRHVVRFQREQNLPAFGIVGPLTRAAITKVCGPLAGGSPAQGQPTFSATPTSETGHSLTVTFTVGNLNSTTANQQFTVSFGDGTSGTLNGPGCSETNSIPGSINCGTTASISHTYTASGTYTATLTQGKIQCGTTNSIPGDPIYCPKTIGAVTITVNSINGSGAATCTFNGQTIANGESVTAYASSTVPSIQQCVSERRTCINGKLTGSYGNSSCVEQPCNNINGCGPILTPAVSFSAKQTSVVPGTRTALVWSATNATWCSASGGWSGMKATSGTEETANLWQTTTFNLTCFGSDYQTPVTKSVIVAVLPEEPAQKRSCIQDSVTVAHGASYTFYSAQAPEGGNACRDNLIPSELRTCNDGTLSGSFPYASCTIPSTTQGQPTFSAVPTSGAAPLSVIFTVGNLNSTTANQQFTVSFGDGTSGTLNGPGCSTTNSIPGSVECGKTATISHTYTASGTYTATLSGPCTVKFAGCSGPTLGTVTITVTASLPITDANCEPSSTNSSIFSVQVTSPTIATISFMSMSYQRWTGFDFGDGTKLDPVWGSPLVHTVPSSGISCTRHTYANPGTYLIRQTLDGVPLSCGTETCKTVNVY